MKQTVPVLRTATLLAAGALLAACATVNVGQDFDLARFEDSVRHNVSTRDDIRRWLGEPSGRGAVINADGERHEKWTYYHGRGKLPKLADAQLKFLEIEFDGDGRVVSYNWTR